jgi:hypothetical protein
LSLLALLLSLSLSFFVFGWRARRPKDRSLSKKVERKGVDLFNKTKKDNNPEERD